jgi:hypothetical protein
MKARQTPAGLSRIMNLQSARAREQCRRRVKAERADEVIE